MEIYFSLFMWVIYKYIYILLFQLVNSYLWLLKLDHNIAPRNSVLNHFRKIKKYQNICGTQKQKTIQVARQIAKKKKETNTQVLKIQTRLWALYKFREQSYTLYNTGTCHVSLPETAYKCLSEDIEPFT